MFSPRYDVFLSDPRRVATISGTDYSAEGAPGPSQLGTGEEARFDPPTQNELWIVQPKENSSPEVAVCPPICLGMILDRRQQPKHNLSSTASW